MKLVKLVKAVIHVYAKNGDLQYSFWNCGDHNDHITAKYEIHDWCITQNEEAGYEKYHYEIVNLYGEATKW